MSFFNEERIAFACLQFRLFLQEFKRLHYWLIKYRVVGVGVTLLACWLCLDTWLFYKKHFAELGSFNESTGLGMLIMAYIGLLRFGLNNISSRHPGEEE